MIKAGIVGMGGWGRTLVESVSGGSDVIRFIAGATRTPSAARDYAVKAGLQLYGSLDDLLAHDDLDAVVLASPHTAHFPQILAAANAGKHVYCEKPFCLSAAEAADALQALAANGLKVAVGHDRRFYPNTAELSRVIGAGELGRMVQIEGNFSADLAPASGTWRASRAESPAGGMTSLGIHLVDAFIHLFGRIEYVQAISRRVALPFDIDDATVVTMEFEGGQLGYLGTVASTAPLWQIRAFGSGGWSEIVDHHRLTVTTGRERSETRTWEYHGYPCLPPVAAALEAFARDCEGSAPFPISPDEILHGVAVLEAIVESAATGNRVAVATQALRTGKAIR